MQDVCRALKREITYQQQRPAHNHQARPRSSRNHPHHPSRPLGAHHQAIQAAGNSIRTRIRTVSTFQILIRVRIGFYNCCQELLTTRFVLEQGHGLSSYSQEWPNLTWVMHFGLLDTAMECQALTWRIAVLDLGRNKKQAFDTADLT
jgi:hypothetical protein